MHRASSWTEFLDIIKAVRLGSKGLDLWYRGQSDFNHTLLPSLFRSENGFIVEKEVFKTYRKISYRVQGDQKNDWETLFDMQHNWIPTRLLDWTENLGISVYFATRYNKNNSDMAIYILNPKELNLYSNKSDIPVVQDEPMALDYVQNYLDKKPFPPRYPIAISPNFSNERMVAQRGIFTIHGDDLTPIEILCPKAVMKIVLGAEAIDEAREFLELANINEYTVFPDMNGVADYIRRTVLQYT
ncbi:FRG domain-containing protein [Aeromonas hydrophila]|uniref:FRG domain-containing protein n=1 Tax=Aeromonas hydrophila TaxID=644 RepID=UPI003D22C81E